MYIACDIGGTKFRVAKSIDCKNFEEPIIKDTPDNPKEGIDAVINTIKEISGTENISAISIGIAGVLNKEHTLLLKSPHLPAWEKIDFSKIFQDNFKDTKIFIENDADIVGLGEAVDGAGKGYEIVVYLTISTGIGGAKIINGRFEKNRFGFEPGFQILNNQTLQNWELLCSGTAIEEKYKMHPKDVAQTENWLPVVDDVAVGLHNTILFWSPDVVVIGGSMAKDLDANILKEKVAKLMKIHPQLPDIKIATLGSIGGINGGFAFLRDQLGLN